MTINGKQMFGIVMGTAAATAIASSILVSVSITNARKVRKFKRECDEESKPKRKKK